MNKGRDSMPESERERAHTRKVQRILYSRSAAFGRVMREILEGAVAILLVVFLAFISSDFSPSSATVRAVAITAGSLVSVVLVMVLTIRYVQARRRHLQGVRTILKGAYVEATYELLSGDSADDADLT